MKTTYDEVIKQPVDRLAQTMQDMTYCFNETVVPKKPYKKLLTKQLEEVVADSVTINMVNAYYKTLAEFNKGNREWYVAAVLCIELGVNPSKAKPTGARRHQPPYSGRGKSAEARVACPRPENHL